MRSHRFHHPLFGMGWSPSQLVLIILVGLLFLIFLLIFLTITAQPAQGQTSAPATAVQAAKLPQFASKLSHAIKLSPEETASRLRRAQPHASYNDGLHISPLDSNDTYDNGPINGTTDAWTINFGYAIADSFNLPNSGNLSGMSFGAWLEPGDTLQTVEISITNAPFGGTSYFDQVVTVTQSGCVSNQYGFNVCTVSATWPDAAFNSGTYWVNLQNAVDNEGNLVYWDENSGVGCTGSGCPSSASESSIGTIPSESFTLLGEGTTSAVNEYACPAPQNGFRELHDFGVLGTGDLASGLSVDPAGNVYGTLSAAGEYAQGLIYGLAQRAGHWFFNSLYSFPGGVGGSGPYGTTFGPEGDLYGSAAGGSYGYGLVYKATPPAITCHSGLCSWRTTTIYEFTNGEDEGAVAAFDAAGNLYGISCCGGAYGQGAIFELSRSQGGWTEKLLYSFTGGSDGGGPNSLVLGHDGNLYGAAGYGGNAGCGLWGQEQCGVIFQLVPSRGDWAENVLHAFTGGAEDGWSPFNLIQDRQGNLYGLSVCFLDFRFWGGCGDAPYPELAGVIFNIGTDGEFNEIHTYSSTECQESNGNVIYHALVTDAAGNLYASEGGSDMGVCNPPCTYYCGGILQVQGIQGTPLVSGDADIFGNLASDANGNLYGTTATCGFRTSRRNTSMVWTFSP